MSVEAISNYSDLVGELPEAVIEIIKQVSKEVGTQVIIQSSFVDCGGFGLRTKNGEYIGEIYMGKFCVGYDTYPHIGVEVGKQFRRLGIGTKLYYIWQEFGNELLEEEYTRQQVKVKFLQELGYIPVAIIHDETGREIEIDGEIPWKKIGRGYACKLVFEG